MTAAAGPGSELGSLISPASIALVGASDSPERIGGRILARLKETYQGDIFPVNPSRDVVQGLPAFPSIAATETAADLAIVATPAAGVADVARECAAKGVRSMLVLSAGFAETGEPGRRRQEELREVTSAAGIRVCGPNCIGIVNLTIGLRAVFSSIQAFSLRPGNIAIVSQSGAFGMTLFELAQTAGLGASYLYAAGNEMDVTCGEVLSYLVEQPDVQTIGLFLEGVRKPEVLLAAARRARVLGKPIVAIKVSRSEAGTRAAASHTGAVAVASNVTDAAFDDVGIVRARTARQMIDYLTVFSSGRVPRGRRLAVMTISGGVGVMMADTAAATSLHMPPTSAALRADLEQVIPDFGSATNPVDVTAHVVNDQAKIHSVLTTLSSSGEYDMVCISGAPRGLGKQLLDSYEKAFRATEKPLAVYGPQPDVNLDLVSRGIPTIPDPAAVIEALGALWDYHERRRQALSAPARESDDPESSVPRLDAVDRTLTEDESRRIIEPYGVTFPYQQVVSDADEAVAAAARVQGPVVLKISAEWLPHKSARGGVLIGLRTPGEVAAGFERLATLAREVGPDAQPTKVLVQELVPPGLELSCGAFRDPTFGPGVSLGLGGVMIEILAEQALSLAPVDDLAAARMLESVAGGRLLRGRMALTATAAAAVRAAVVGLGRLMLSEPAIAEIDLNPIIINGDRAVAVDALVVTAARR